jgi:diguanylate cyclase (GGDEF)-like protein
MRESDMLCRYGGEEFAILLTRAEPPASALAAVERIRIAATQEAIHVEGRLLAIRASAGLYSAVPAEGARLDEYLVAADAALYEAKAAGRDRSVLRPPPL